MKILVELNRKEEFFQIQEVHKRRLINEFSQHDFVFMSSYQEFKERLTEAEAALVWIFPERLFAETTQLKALFTPAAGKNWVAEDSMNKVKTYFSSFHGGMIAESFLSMLLFNNNNLKPALENQSKAQWNRSAFGHRTLLKNQSLLIVGYGNIGYHCSEVAQALGMKVKGACRNLTRKANCDLLDIHSIKEYISEYDHVLNLLPGDQTTEGFFSQELINKMKQGGSFYNFGRGTTVDESALALLLKNGHLKFAGLDVFSEEPLPESSPLWGIENAVLTPHSSCIYEDYLHLFIDELKSKL